MFDRVITSPLILDGPASHQGNEEVADVEDGDGAHQNPEGNALPPLVRAYPEQEEANDQFDEGRDDNVEERGDPAPHDGLRSILGSHMFDVFADAVADAQEGDSTIADIKGLEDVRSRKGELQQGGRHTKQTMASQSSK